MPVQRTDRRRSLAVLSALALASQSAGLLHFLLVDHEFCAAHGALVHGHSHGTDTGHASSAPSAFPSLDESGHQGPRASSHEHCTVLAERAQSPERPADQSVAFTRSPLLSVLEAPARPPMAVLAVAPKASPPVAG